MEHVVKPLSNHSSVYRGFVIVRRPRNKLQPVTRYLVSMGDQSYGHFDAQAQATSFIDDLFSERDAFDRSREKCTI